MKQIEILMKIEGETQIPTTAIVETIITIMRSMGLEAEAQEITEKPIVVIDQ